MKLDEFDKAIIAAVSLIVTGAASFALWNMDLFNDTAKGFRLAPTDAYSDTFSVDSLATYSVAAFDEGRVSINITGVPDPESADPTYPRTTITPVEDSNSPWIFAAHDEPPCEVPTDAYSDTFSVDSLATYSVASFDEGRVSINITGVPDPESADPTYPRTTIILHDGSGDYGFTMDARFWQNPQLIVRTAMVGGTYPGETTVGGFPLLEDQFNKIDIRNTPGGIKVSVNGVALPLFGHRVQTAGRYSILSIYKGFTDACVAIYPIP